MNRLRLNEGRAAMAGGGAAAIAAIQPNVVTGLLTWHDFSLISTLFVDAAKTTPVTADADLIGAVEDRSGNGRDATQATGGKLPYYKTNIQNGLSMALQSENINTLATASISHGIGTGNFLWMGVVKMGTVGASPFAVCTNGSYAPSLKLQGSTLNHAGIYWASDIPFTNLLLSDTVYLVELYRNAGEISLVINGVTDATVLSVATSMPNGVLYILQDGGYSAARPYLGEWLTYTGYPSASILGLRKYFKDKWGLTF